MTMTMRRMKKSVWDVCLNHYVPINEIPKQLNRGQMERTDTHSHTHTQVTTLTSNCTARFSVADKSGSNKERSPLLCKRRRITEEEDEEDDDDDEEVEDEEEEDI